MFRGGRIHVLSQPARYSMIVRFMSRALGIPVAGRSIRQEGSLRRLLCAFCLSLGFLVCAAAQPTDRSRPAMPQSATNGAADATPTLWVIPHTHWEGAVFKTREEYLEIGLPHILTALNLLRTHPKYRFVLDQVAYVKPFLERFPEEAPEFRKFVAEGRLQIVGANDVMLDVNIPSGESWVRQALYGKEYYKRVLGVD